MRVGDDIRVGEWWSHKLAPLLATGYATAYFAGAQLTDVAPALVVALIALAAGSAYVSLLNDLTDRDADAAAGKANRSAGRSPGRSAALVAGAIVTGWLPVLALWSGSPAVLVAYLAPWLAFTAYSLPPLRLKRRGLAGALADAAGAELLPRLFVVAVVLDRADAGRALDWVLPVGVWAAALGVRGAILHQLDDVDADRRAGVRTFALLHPAAARRVGRWIAFPVEVTAFVVVLAVSGNVAALALLAPYAAFELLAVRRLGKSLVIVGPADGDAARVVLQDFYVVVFPLAFLVAATVRAPADAAVLAAHVVLFAGSIRALGRTARDLLYVLRRDLNPAFVRDGPKAPDEERVAADR